MTSAFKLFLGALAIAGSGFAWTVGCANAGDTADAQGLGNPPGNGAPGTGSTTDTYPLCKSCLTDQDCNGGSCAQFQGDSFCAPACPNGDECASDRACTVESSASGQQVSVCTPSNPSACGGATGGGGGTGGTGGSGGGGGGGAADAGGGGSSGGGGGGGNTCGSLVGPTGSASCHSCGSSSSKTCQPNGCYGGWYCDTTTTKCQAPPANCSGGGGGGSSDGGGGGGGGGGTIDGGPVTGSVGPTGGTVSRLYFTAIGDTRPANVDDTAGYPTAIIDQIYADVAALSPAPLFSVSTGDYMFATPSSGQASPQIDLYMQARAKFAGVFFPAMGNHECTGYTASNCGSGNTDGVTDNYTQFLTKMLGPISKTAPYYSININASDGSWTSKFVFIAANAWDSAQSSWLSGVLGQATTYTFILRHEATSANTAPGVGPSDQIISQHPYTMKIVGHTHTYQRTSQQEVIYGNGGAPITGSSNYGFGLIQQRPDGAIQFEMIDYQSKQSMASFAVKADGTTAP